MAFLIGLLFLLSINTIWSADLKNEFNIERKVPISEYIVNTKNYPIGLPTWNRALVQTLEMCERNASQFVQGGYLKTDVSLEEQKTKDAIIHKLANVYSCVVTDIGDFVHKFPLLPHKSLQKQRGLLIGVLEYIANALPGSAIAVLMGREYITGYALLAKELRGKSADDLEEQVVPDMSLARQP